MVKVALCMKNTIRIDSILHEMNMALSQRGICADTHVSLSADQLLRRTKEHGVPDILLYEMNGEGGHTRDVALKLKRRNAKLISIVTDKPDDINLKEQVLLQPIYSLPAQHSDVLWSYLCRTYELLLSDKDSFTYYKRPDFSTVPLNNVIYFNSEGRQVRLVMRDGQDSFYQKLDDVELTLQQKNHHFTRIHKSYLVNTDYVTDYDRSSLTLATGETLNISRYQYYKEINHRFKCAAQ